MTSFCIAIAGNEERLLKRGYPVKFIDNCFRKVHYHNRIKYIQSHLPTPVTPKPPPIFKSPLVPNYNLLRKIILQNFNSISHVVTPPLIIQCGHQTIQKMLTSAKLVTTDKQFVEIHIATETISNLSTDNHHSITVCHHTKSTLSMWPPSMYNLSVLQRKPTLHQFQNPKEISYSRIF